MVVAIAGSVSTQVAIRVLLQVVEKMAHKRERMNVNRHSEKERPRGHSLLGTIIRGKR